MRDQFIFFCVNIGIEKLLKEEISTFYPELTLSYSRKGFITFKNTGVRYDTHTISQLSITFATRVGLCLGKATPDEIKSTTQKELLELGLSLNDCMIHNFSINTNESFDATEDFGEKINDYSAEGTLVLNLITLGQHEIWFGLHRVAKGITRYPNAHVDVQQSNLSPSSGYQKLAQINELYALKFSAKETWLDFGCSPGGSSAYLLSLGSKVWGIDTADVADSIKNHRNFKFIKSSVQDISHEKLPDIGIHWVHADLNLNPNQAIKEVLRLCKKYNQTLKGIVFTVQVVKIEYIKSIEDFEDIFYDWGFSTMISHQVPSHKKEYALIARRNIRREIKSQ